MDTVYKLNEYFKFNNYDIRVVGAPKTIDNDLNLTDHCPDLAQLQNILQLQ